MHLKYNIVSITAKLAHEIQNVYKDVTSFIRNFEGRGTLPVQRHTFDEVPPLLRYYVYSELEIGYYSEPNLFCQQAATRATHRLVAGRETQTEQIIEGPATDRTA